MRRLFPIGFTLLLAIPVTAVAAPSLGVSAAKKASSGPTERQVLFDKVDKAIGDRVVCACMDAGVQGHVGQLVITLSSTNQSRGPISRCIVLDAYNADGKATQRRMCPTYEVLGRLRKNVSF